MSSIKEDIFINQLLQETYALEGHHSVIDYRSTRELTFLKTEVLISFDIEFLSEISCYRIFIEDVWLDLPCNFEIFEYLRILDRDRVNDVYLYGDQNYTCDDFYQMLSLLLGSQYFYYFAKENNRWKLCGCSAGSASQIFSLGEVKLAGQQAAA